MLRALAWVCCLAGIGLLGAAIATSARAQSVETALPLLASSSYADIEKGIEALAGSGHANAAALLQAMADGKLLVGPGKAVIQSADGKFADALSGQAVANAQGLAAPRVNNRIRRAIDAALGTLTIMSPDPARRLEAAASVFKTRDLAARPLIETALAKETDSRVRRAFEQARAALILADKSPDSDKLAAIAILAERGDQDARAILAAVGDGSPQVVAAARSAVERIESRLAIWNGVQSVYYGISLGSVLLLAAIGLAITFGVMGVINMAHGEMVMLGAYTTFAVQEIIRTSAPGLFDWSLAIALPLAFLVSGAVGMAIERGIIRFLYGRPLETLLATFGLSLVLQQAVRTIFGANNREVGNPSWMSGAFELGGLTLTYNRMWIIVFAFAVLAALMVVLRRTAFGLQMRAVTQNRRMAASMGIRTSWVDCLTFGLGSGIAGIAGVALSQIDNVSPNLGQGYIIDSFMVVVFGGVGNLWGTLVGALSLGIANKLLEPVAGAVLGKIIVLVLIVLFIQRKPRGLFPLKGRAVET
ncbi:MAG: urea ABC transporter permease subunit UrtB [Reyranellaceae bacterium]